jgi:hypothetical protein
MLDEAAKIIQSKEELLGLCGSSLIVSRVLVDGAEIRYKVDQGDFYFVSVSMASATQSFPCFTLPATLT